METEIANQYKHNIHTINPHIILGSNKYNDRECRNGGEKKDNRQKETKEGIKKDNKSEKVKKYESRSEKRRGKQSSEV